MKFSQPVVDAILKDLEDEIPYKYACESNGVVVGTFQKWLENGKKDILDGKDNSYYAQLLVAVRKIEKNRVKKHLLNINSGEKSHRGSEWVLERSFWKHFGKAAEIELNERVEALENKGNLDAEKIEEESKE